MKEDEPGSVVLSSGGCGVEEVADIFLMMKVDRWSHMAKIYTGDDTQIYACPKPSKHH